MQFFLILLIPVLMARVNALAIVDVRDSVVRQADISFPCPCIDHWFKHERSWIQASSVDGCMALETKESTIWALNKLPKPQYSSRSYPNLACSLIKQRCSWNYSPLDQVSDPPQTSVARSTDEVAATREIEQPSKRASEAVQQVCEILPGTS